MLSRTAERLAPLAGVVHAAGALDDGVLSQQSWPRFEQVLAPKVGGAWHLHELTREMPLDLFVCFSSVASLLGSPGQGNYAAANAFLDALAHHRRAAGLPALTVNWGPWFGGGMASSLSEGERRRLSAQGLDSLSPEQALGALDDLLAAGATQAGVLRMDWPKLLRSFPRGGEPPLLSELARQVPRSGGGPTARRQEQLLRDLEQAPAERRRELLVAYLQGQAMRVLGIPPDQLPDPRQPLTELGLDSLMGVELKNRLAVELGVETPLERFVEVSTVDQLAEMLSEQLALARLVPAAPPSGEIHEDMEELTL